jgi:biopolymer transport protein ExbB
LDRFTAFYQNSKIDVRSLRAQVLTLLEEDKIDDAKTLCQSTPGPVSAVLLAGLQSYSKLKSMNIAAEALRAMLTKTMDDYIPHALNAVEKRLNILSTVGNASPLLGMAGTVIGMIKSFSSIAQAGAMDAGIVGAGIAEALITTAAGLLIALFAVIPYNIFMSSVEKISLDMEQAASEMTDFLTIRSSGKTD